MTLRVNPIVGSLAVAGAPAASFAWVDAQRKTPYFSIICTSK
jgi:hypothetical protein